MAQVLTGKTDRPPHLKLIEDLFVAAATGQVRRLMICVPPRHGKSETCSHYGPAWYLSRWPDKRVILCSYAAEFAESWGRKARDTFAEAHSLGLIPYGVAGDLSRASEWGVDGHEGFLLTAGVGGQVTGRGCNLLLVDDPTKNAEEAASLTYQERSWEWFNSTARTRLEPGGSVVVINTRWHHNDLSGRILANEGADWTVVNLPALAEDEDPLGRNPGEALWPERYDTDELDRIRLQLGSHAWGSLYQQRPTPREGGYFKRHWFEIVDVAPAQVAARCRYWDKAATDQGGDYTAGVRVSRTEAGVFYVEDVIRDQLSSGAVKQTVLQTAQLDGEACEIMLEQEPGSSGKDVVNDYAKLLRGYRFRGEKVTGSKEVRADGLAAQAEAGNVKLVRGPWNEEFLNELTAFPNGAHDDQVDAASGAFRRVARDRQVRSIYV